MPPATASDAKLRTPKPKPEFRTPNPEREFTSEAQRTRRSEWV